MPYTLPIFNLTADVWRPPNAPPSAPDSTVPCQLYFPTRQMFDVTPGSNSLWQPPVYLRVPTGTSVRVGDVVEVATGDGWFYRVRFVERAHRGFGNEYLIAVLEQGSDVVPPSPPPFPPPPPPPPSGGFVLIESTGFVLMEGSGNIRLE